MIVEMTEEIACRPEAQKEALRRLCDEGFVMTNVYGDGIVRVARPLPNGDSLVAFVREDGSHRPPTCWEERIAKAPPIGPMVFS